MADADTIVVLDGIQHQKETTSDIYTQDHATNEAVKTLPVYVNPTYKAARVIFNGAYDPDGGRFHGRVKVTGITSITAPTKVAHSTNQQVMEWTIITPPAVIEAGPYDCSAEWGTLLHIDIAQSSVDPNTTGIEIIVQGQKEDSLNEWTDIARPVLLSLGAATKSDFKAQEAAAQTILSVTAPTTGKLNHLGKFVFLEDTAAIEKCEIAFVVECGADA